MSKNKNKKNGNMNKRKDNKIFVISACLIIFVLIFVVIAINLKSKKNNDDVINKTNLRDEIAIKLSINSFNIKKDSPNSKIYVDGMLSLSYDSNKYAGVILSGYCLDSNGGKYLIHGPVDGETLFHNDSNSLLLTEDIPQKIEYTDGTVKALSDVNWDDVRIKYCKVDKMTAVLNESNTKLETALSIQTYFN